MANVKKEYRVSDTDIKRLNNVGLGLRAIANYLGCHAATITIRLKAMGLTPTDTRRSFMEQVFSSLTREEQDWLSHNLFNEQISAKKFVSDLVKEAFANAAKIPTAAPITMPVMQQKAPSEEKKLLFQPDEVITDEVVPPRTETKKLNFG